MLNKQYDFIVCDLDMPVMNGYECATKIRAKYEQKQDFFNVNEEEEVCPLLIACSALITPQIEKKTKDHGFDFAVQSPLTINVIKERILHEVFKRISTRRKKPAAFCSKAENSASIGDG